MSLRTRNNQRMQPEDDVTYSTFVVVQTRWRRRHVATFYLPGVAPTEFQEGQLVDIKAVKLTSTKTQLPYEFYSVPFCQPVKGVFYKSENLGEVLRGDRIVNTPYVVKMKENKACQVLCMDKNMKYVSKSLSKDESEDFKEKIFHDYFVHLITDNLPVATPIKMPGGKTIYERGYRLGSVSGKEAYLHNHLNFILHYHETEHNTFRVVGFEVEPKSFKRGEIIFDEKDGQCKFNNPKNPHKVGGEAGDVLFTYSVEWQQSSVVWASRWDNYLAMNDVQIHWFSIINSVVVVFFLSGILTMIMVRTLRRDIAQYNKDDDLDETIEETGWKLVHGDIFRPPRFSKLLTSFVGAGIQIFCMALITIFFAMLGMLSPAARGSLMTVGIFLYMFMGLFAGYFSARLYKTMKGLQWKKAAFQTATVYPGIMFGVCLLLNFFIWGKHSSGAVPFTTMLALLCMWFGISVPLVFMGFYFGFRKQAYEHPVRTNQIPRQVPEQTWYMNPFLG
ncbi:transmembrane 9 superfamily member [Elysia marginata]|uniref:Transmembrane 9 superfamily member n=1 Tax=Elysia marginata TaxID=1093978 RepID=A0AAV4GRZ2_9GAST|nr:transmembrane 9 superfamily member [Elysia marginata]